MSYNLNTEAEADADSRRREKEILQEQVKRLEAENETLRGRNRRLSMALVRVFPGAGTTNAAMRLAAELPATRHLVRSFES